MKYQKKWKKYWKKFSSYLFFHRPIIGFSNKNSALEDYITKNKIRYDVNKDYGYHPEKNKIINDDNPFNILKEDVSMYNNDNQPNYYILKGINAWS